MTDISKGLPIHLKTAYNQNQAFEAYKKYFKDAKQITVYAMEFASVKVKLTILVDFFLALYTKIFLFPSKISKEPLHK